MNQGTTASD